MFRPTVLKLPQTPFGRFRVLALAMALASVVMCAATILASGHHPLVRLRGTLLLVALAGYWVAGYRRGSFALALEPLEAYALFLVLSVAPGDPFLPLLGLLFRSLYGGPVRAIARWALWMGAMLAAHDGRGAEQMHGDVARAVGSLIVPILSQALLYAMRTSETIQRRLSSIVQNSTDVVTIVGEARPGRGQAESIETVLGQEPSSLVGTRLHDLVHPDDRPALDGYFTEAEDRPDHSRNLTLRLVHGKGGHRHFDVVAANRLHDPSVNGYVLNMRD